MKRFRDGIIGFILGSILCSSIGYAASTLEVDFLPLKYFFDGVEKRPSKDLQGFIYNDRTYVPLRFIAESMGKEVSWEDETNSIFIGNNREAVEKDVYTSKRIQAYGEWVYYIEGDLENHNLFKIRKDGVMKTRLNDAFVKNFCVVDDWIYFVEEKYDEITSIGKMEFYRMKLDGSRKAKIDEAERINSFFIQDGIIYYIVELSKWGSGNQLYKINTDGTYKELVYVEPIRSNIGMRDGWLYFISNDIGVEKISLKGSKKNLRVIKESVKTATMAGDWIYYTVSPTGNMYKIKTDGTSKTLLLDKKVNSKVVIGDWIYYIEEGTVSDTSDWKLRRIKIDKTEDTLIIEGIKDFIIKGDWIYFTDRYSNANLYKMTLDGSNKKLIYSHVDSLEAICDNYAIVYNKDSNKKLIRTDILHYDEVSPEEILAEENMKENQTALKKEVKNLIHRGYEMVKGEKIVEDEDMIYFINYEDNMSLYKMDKNGDNKVKLSDGGVTSLAIAENWIYYNVNNSKEYPHNSELYKMKTDGREKRKIVDGDSIRSYYVINDTIIYLAEETNLVESNIGIRLNRRVKKIYRTDTDGTDKQLINDDGPTDIQIQGDDIFYVKSGSWYLYKSDFEKNNDIQMNREITEDIQLQDNWIYYRNRYRNSTIYKIRNDGMGRQSLSDLPVKEMIVKGEWIYYIDSIGNSAKIYKIKTDGTSEIQISSKERVRELIGVVGEWIYYEDKEGKMKRLKVDGSTVQEI